MGGGARVRGRATTSAGWSPTEPARRRSRRGVGEGLRARPEPARHARLGQPLPRGAGRGDRVPSRRRAGARLEKGRLTVMVHTGSRGFGHQVCTDALGVMQGAMRRYEITLPDRQLACAPLVLAGGADAISAPCGPRRTSPSRTGSASPTSPARPSSGPRRVAARARLAPGLRRGPQHRQGGGPRGGRPHAGASSCTERAPRARSRRATPSCRRRTGRWASRC